MLGLHLLISNTRFIGEFTKITAVPTDSMVLLLKHVVAEFGLLLLDLRKMEDLQAFPIPADNPTCAMTN